VTSQSWVHSTAVLDTSTVTSVYESYLDVTRMHDCTCSALRI
jgi:hypothetical protein